MANTSLPNYMTKTSLIDSYYTNGSGGVQTVNLTGQNTDVANFMSSVDLLQGIECSPYQFLDSVDARYVYRASSNTSNGPGSTNQYIGQKYAQKILTQMPLIFFTPCEPVFMEGFSNADKNNVLSTLLTGGNDSAPLQFVMDKQAQYYGVRYAYSDYYDYVNVMLTSIAYYLGIQDYQININGALKPIRSINWARNTNDTFKSYFDSAENIVFFADSLTSVDLSFSNSTGPSSLASMINGYSDQINELQFLLGGNDSVISNMIDSSTDAASSITSSLSEALGSLAGGIVGSLADTGVNTILNGGKVIFPEIWTDSSHDESYSLTFKLRSPDHDSLSIFLNILKPYCLLLALSMPRVIIGNPNGYRSPFLIKCFSKGLFNVNMGIVESMQITKGDECQWNDDGLPTQMDININIKNLYSHLAMSGYRDSRTLYTNSQYQDFLANTAGLNVKQFNSSLGNRIDAKVYMLNTKYNIKNVGSRLYTRASNSISNVISNVVNRF